MYYAALGDTVVPINSPEDIYILNQHLSDADKALYPDGYVLTPETLAIIAKMDAEVTIDRILDGKGYTPRKKLVTTINGAYMALMGCAAIIVQSKEPDNAYVNGLIDMWYPLALQMIEESKLDTDLLSVIGAENIMNDVIMAASDAGETVKAVTGV